METMGRTVSDVPRRASESAFRTVGDEGGLVVLPGRAEVKVLNPVGSRVYALIDGKRTLGEIVGTIEQEFDVTIDQATADVEEFLSILESEGLVDPATEPAA